MKKKILFLITNLAHGGAERVLVNLVNNLDKNKYDITVMTLFDVGVNTQNLSNHVTYKYLFSRSFHGIKLITSIFPAKILHKLFIRNKYDIEVSYLEGPPAKIISGGNNNTKKIAWIHIELNDDKLFSEGFLNKQDALNTYGKFNKIVCVSETVKSQFIKVSGMDNRNIKVLYNTNETETIKSISKQPVDDLVFGDGIPTIVSVAKIEHSKGYDRLLEIHKRLIDEGIQHRVYVFGIGDEKNKLELLSQKYGVEDTFKFVGFKDKPYNYLSKADLYVCSSRREGFSTAVTEALIVGIPVVSTECSGAKELLGENNEYGIVVENSTEGVYQGVRKMLLDNELRKNYKEQAIARGEYFSKEKTVKAVEEMLDLL